MSSPGWAAGARGSPGLGRLPRPLSAHRKLYAHPGQLLVARVLRPVGLFALSGAARGAVGLLGGEKQKKGDKQPLRQEEQLDGQHRQRETEEQTAPRSPNPRETIVHAVAGSDIRITTYSPAPSPARGSSCAPAGLPLPPQSQGRGEPELMLLYLLTPTHGLFQLLF